VAVIPHKHRPPTLSPQLRLSPHTLPSISPAAPSPSLLAPPSACPPQRLRPRARCSLRSESRRISGGTLMAEAWCSSVGGGAEGERAGASWATAGTAMGAGAAAAAGTGAGAGAGARRSGGAECAGAAAGVGSGGCSVCSLARKSGARKKKRTRKGEIGRDGWAHASSKKAHQTCNRGSRTSFVAFRQLTECTQTPRGPPTQRPRPLRR